MNCCLRSNHDQWNVKDNANSESDLILDFNKLRKILLNSKTCDVYCRSALYFMFTGRGKVWGIKYDDNYLILIRHPNAHEILLVFFPFAYNAPDLSNQILTLCNYKSFLGQFKEIHLARIPHCLAITTERMFRQDNHRLNIKIIDETILDWAYPSYDICLNSLINPEGGRLKSYRNKIRKPENKGIEIINAKDLDQQKLQNAVRQVSTSWAQTKVTIKIEELINSYQTLIQLNNNLNVNGLILKKAEAYVAFNFWEVPSVGNIVPGIAALHCPHQKGISEYLYYCTAQQLVKYGYDHMCIGGSETASLDRFKQKLAPINTHILSTIKLQLEL